MLRRALIQSQRLRLLASSTMKTRRSQPLSKKALPEIAQVIDAVARSLRDGGRLIYIGAGSSGRIAALDSCECPPYFSTSPQTVQYIMAGGPKALASPVEVNEDSEELGQRDIARRRPTRKDVSSDFPPADARRTWLRQSPMPGRAAQRQPALPATTTRLLRERRRHRHRRRRRARGHLRLDAHEGRDRAEDDHQHDHHRRDDPARAMCTRT